MRWRLALAVVSLLVLTSCTQIADFLGLNKDYFADYRGVNLLRTHDFGSAVWTTTTAGLITAGTDNYMRWEDSGALGQDGKSRAFRVEIQNLLPNGDFETGSLDTNYWSKIDALNTNNVVWTVATSHANNGQIPPTPLPATARTIDNQSLLFAANDGGDYLILDLQKALGGLWRPGQYRLRMNMINASLSKQLHIQLINPAGILGNVDAENGGTWSRSDLEIVTSAKADTISRFFTVTKTTDQRQFRLGHSTNIDAAIIDDVRVVLANQDLSAVALFPSLYMEPNLPLLPGQAYTFTVWVLDDPTAIQGVAAHALNRFEPSGLTISVLGKDKNSSTLKSLAKVFFPRPAAGWAAWTQLTVQGGIDFVTKDTDLGDQNALEIHLSPTNQIDLTTNGKDVGSLLVSQPVLTFNP